MAVYPQLVRRDLFFESDDQELIAIFERAIDEEHLDLVRESLVEAFSRKASGIWEYEHAPETLLVEALLKKAKSVDFISQFFYHVPVPFLSALDQVLVLVYETKSYPKHAQLIEAALNEFALIAVSDDLSLVRDPYLLHRFRVYLAHRHHHGALAVGREVQKRARAKGTEGIHDKALADILWAAIVSNDTESELRSLFVLVESLDSGVQTYLHQRLKAMFGEEFAKKDLEVQIADLTEIKDRQKGALIDCVFTAISWQSWDAFIYFDEKLGAKIDFSTMSKIRMLTIREQGNVENPLLMHENLIQVVSKEGCARMHLWLVNLIERTKSVA